MPKPKFSEGERVLCFHGPLIYEAKCLKVSTGKDKVTPKYFIHYAGWNKNWDEWVPESRILKYNDVNLSKQTEVKTAHADQQKSAKKRRRGKVQSTDPSDSSSESGSSSGRKESRRQKVQETSTTPIAAQNTHVGKHKRESMSRTSTPTNESSESAKRPPAKRVKMSDSNSTVTSNVALKDSFLRQVEIKIVLPKDLNMILVDDWNHVVREKKLITLPVKNNVVTVLNNFVPWKQKQAAEKDEKLCIPAFEEFIEGVKEYFNVLLGSQLLYRFERVQYAEIIEKYSDKTMAEIYGAFHLLRLFVRLGTVISHSAMDEKCVKLLQFHVQEFLKYLLKANYFDYNEYVTASPEYIRKTF